MPPDTRRTWMQRSNPSSFDASLEEECDDNVRPAVLWLYCTPIRSSADSRKQVIHSLGEVAVNNKEYAHWILVFKFDNGTISAIEGTNENNHLMPSYWKRIDERWNQVRKIATVDVSPRQIRELAVGHPLNGQGYSLYGSNCHVWANLVLGKLGLNELPNTIDNEIVGAIATVATAGFFASLLYIFLR